MDALNACVDDMKHLTAVRPEQHVAFAEENGMASFFMSAKTYVQQ